MFDRLTDPRRYTGHHKVRSNEEVGVHVGVHAGVLSTWGHVLGAYVCMRCTRIHYLVLMSMSELRYVCVCGSSNVCVFLCTRLRLCVEVNVCECCIQAYKRVCALCR